MTITLEDHRIDKKEIFHYEGGIKSFVEYINRKKTPIHSKVIFFEETKDGVNVQVTLQYNDEYSKTVLTFANNIHTIEGGYKLEIALAKEKKQIGRAHV